MKSVAIVGLGWLGVPLAKHLQHLGWEVKGSKRTHEGVEQMRLFGIETYHLELTPEINADPDDLTLLFSVDALVINIPPSQYFFDMTQYILGIENVLNEALLHGVQQVIFISSTSVFPEVSGQFDESILPQPTSLTAKGLYEIEQRLLACQHIHMDIIRFAGLVGEGRHPVHTLSKRENVVGGNQPVNLVHLDDCARAIQLLLETPSFQRVYHLSAPIHPTKQDYYTYCAEKLGINVPHFISSDQAPQRIILGDKICHELGFVYQYPDPKMMI
ncbi:SDR family oxidoreductase [Conservatibacter flavescens]|uniref:NAD(P)-dependent oxidoreductase n=1 Tax=Conservatibacter flavescens TaxID=28161 RepID=A0A2M8S260_9PAST|nr:SDR family oxidoreductase [Conservatibacter flavescens]PJG85186.1 NAD(P)-dependent oxidoreductase [Conservatibacter flavescens]